MLTLRLSPEAHALLEEGAKKEHRSKANMADHAIRVYCGANGIGVSEPVTTKGKAKK